MKKFKSAAAALAALATVVTMSGCTAAGSADEDIENGSEIVAPETPDVPSRPQPPPVTDPEAGGEELPPEEEGPVVPEPPKVKKITYINVLSEGVNIRSGAGTNYAVRGSAEKSTMYALDGATDGWYKTGYKNKSAYISSKYCKQVEMTASEDDRIEAVIAEGTKLLGTAYVFGAVRYHDGNGKLLKDFTTGAFDCSSLMQYIFKLGANVNLDMTSRSQSIQGTAVSKANLKRGDLMFFTNDSRVNNTGVERIGHVGMYLGDNYILHTASDYAVIEQISAKRWSYFINARRFV